MPYEAPDWDFGVESVEVTITRGGVPIPNSYQAIIHDTKPIVYYIGTDKYYPVEHRELVGPIYERYNLSTDLNIEPMLTHQGGRLYLNLIRTESTPTPLGDLRYGVKIINSLDGSKRLGIHAVILRPICSNGAIATEIIQGYKRRHVAAKNLEVGSFVERIERMLDVATFTAAITRLAAPCDRETFDTILGAVGLPEKYAKQCREVWDMPEVTSIAMSERDTLWGAYNIISYILTHETEKMSYDRVFDFSVALDRAVARHIPATA